MQGYTLPLSVLKTYGGGMTTNFETLKNHMWLFKRSFKHQGYIKKNPEEYGKL